MLPTRAHAVVLAASLTALAQAGPAPAGLRTIVTSLADAGAMVKNVVIAAAP
ncbi:MAG: hypothetical protein JST92_08050 [Deltaproteobacteria bacterium]|nr:hypothetical protein [Deltaproteobacteria bacterium]